MHWVKKQVLKIFSKQKSTPTFTNFQESLIGSRIKSEVCQIPFAVTVFIHACFLAKFNFRIAML
jgi:hypothetical protein